MLQEKKISSKINYDILKTLTEGMPTVTEDGEPPGELTKQNLGRSEADIRDFRWIPHIEQKPCQINIRYAGTESKTSKDRGSFIR